MLQTDLKTRVYHSLAMDRSRGWVFISGGRSKTTPDAGSGEYLAEVQAFQLTQPAQEKLDQKQVMSTTGGSMETGLQAAVAAGKSGGKQVLAYFYSSEVPACRRAWDQVINTPAYKELSSRYTLASIDVLQPAGAADARRVVALRVPALVLLNSDGTVVNRTGDLSSMAEVKTLLTGSR